MDFILQAAGNLGSVRGIGGNWRFKPAVLSVV